MRPHASFVLFGESTGVCLSGFVELSQSVKGGPFVHLQTVVGRGEQKCVIVELNASSYLFHCKYDSPSCSLNRLRLPLTLLQR